MNRPASIVRFEQFYIASYVVGLVNLALTWSTLRVEDAASEAKFGPYYVIVLTILGLAIPVLLWYFIARRGSVVAKWILTVFTAIAVLFMLFSILMLVRGTSVSPLPQMLGVIATLLQATAVYFLFRPDTAGWFGEQSHPV